MKNIIILITGTFTLLIAFKCFSNAYGQTSRSESTLETKQTVLETPRRSTRPRVNFVKTVDFHLRDNENLVFGKLISEDRNKITIERLDQSRIIISTYSKRQINSRTLHTKNIPEARYYLDLAEYFSGRTWDFRDDPDDFIQAIRYCEKAKQSLTSAQREDSERIDQINEKIKKLQADRDIWIKEVQSRAKLKKLEFEATIETRIKELEDKVTANNQKVDKIISDMKDNQLKLENAITAIDAGVYEQLEILKDGIETNRRIIDRIDRTWYRSPQRYYYP